MLQQVTDDAPVNGLLRSFLFLLATSTDRELARQVEYLKTENRVLRGKLPKRIDVSIEERQRLVKLGVPLGAAIKQRRPTVRQVG